MENNDNKTVREIDLEKQIKYLKKKIAAKERELAKVRATTAECIEIQGKLDRGEPVSDEEREKLETEIVKEERRERAQENKVLMDMLKKAARDALNSKSRKEK